MLLRVPAVQTFLADNVAEALAQKLGTKVMVGRVDLRLLNRIIVDDVMIYDQQQKKMLRVARLSASVDILPLFEGEISLGSAQLFGMKANIYRSDASSPLNCQFMIDSLASKDTTHHQPLNLNIASLIIRNGNITYNQYDKPERNSRFSPYHIEISNLSSHIILYKLTDDSLNLSLSRMSLDEKSGIHLKNFSTSLVCSRNGIKVRDLQLSMPGTTMSIPAVNLAYSMREDTIVPGSLKFDGIVNVNRLDPNDLSAFLPEDAIATIPNLAMRIKTVGSDKASATNVIIQSLNSNALVLQTSAKAYNILSAKPSYDVTMTRCNLSENIVRTTVKQLSLPEELLRLGGIDMKGRVMTSDKDNVEGNIDIATTRVGKAKIVANYHRNKAKIHLDTPALNVAQLLDNKDFGTLRCNIDAEAKTSAGRDLATIKSLGDVNGTLKGIINEVTYKNYTYHDINVDAALASSIVSGKIAIDDPNIRFKANGRAALGRSKDISATLSLKDFAPKALGITDAFGRKVIDMDAQANMKGSTIDNMLGSLSINNVCFTDHSDPTKNAYLTNLSLTAQRLDNGEKEITIESDILDADMRGDIMLTQIPNSITNLLAKHLPSLPGLPAIRKTKNDFAIDVRVKDITFLKQIADIPVTMTNEVTLRGFVNSMEDNADITLDAPGLKISDRELQNTKLHFWTAEDGLKTSLTSLLKQNQNTISLSLDCRGADNNLYTTLSWDNMRHKIFNGSVNTVSQFYTDLMGKSAIKTVIPNSNFEIGDTVWTIQSQGLMYEGGKISVQHFAVENSNQHVFIDGVASKNPSDSIVAELKNINVEYIMNLIDFHSVDFAGYASGRAVGYGVMSDLKANAHLDVSEFLFEHGNMGTMHIDADYSNASQSIDIAAVADDSVANAKTIINGYISPQKNAIDLDIQADNTRLEFMGSMCSSFMDEVDLHGTGRVRLHGPLNAINLTGSLWATGGVRIKSTNCHYTMPGDSITFVPDDILFSGCPMQDKYGNYAFLSGGVHHINLGRISFDLTAETSKFLAYDYPTLDGSTFCGHAIVDGSIGLHGKGNEVNITCDCNALKDSYIVYDASSPDAIKSQDFITWGSINNPVVQRDSVKETSDDLTPDNSGNDRTNIRMRLMVNATPDAKLHLLMDHNTGDYIDLYGTGALRVNYYNKGSMDIFGNYAIDHGTYKMTIQNIIRRDFEFQKGGMIAFGGDPYNAVLRMQAAYNLNSVSLADLNIGTSFKANNVPVKCLMDITGTPAKPNVSFDLDLPSLSTDARQMVYSIINSEEEMNQQVLYLLAIGRFYSQQENNTNSQERVGQTSLAMQSFLSGTISQQLNTMLNQAIGSNNWSFGANITPGADGFSNAEYEGLLSGRLFNNRLLFNGQFGYRDNVTTNSQNFIGDFSLQYLLTPNGNFSIKMYNQSNDRYFTRNSLNTQGVGFVIQKEFGK